MSSTGSCNVCQKASTSRCSRCKSVYYCGADHQKSDWAIHSKVCKALAATNVKASGSTLEWNPPKTIAGDKSNSALQNFKLWLTENGVKGIDKLAVEEFESTGRGIKVLENIEAGQVALEVPRALFLTTSDSIRTHPELSKVFSDVMVWNTVSQVPDSILAIRLLYEKHTAVNSPWKFWIETLPKKYNSTLFWSNRDMNLLSAGNLYHLTKQHREQLSQEFNAVVKQTLVKRFPAIFKSSIYTEDEYMWAMATVFSRATEATVDGGHQKFIVPMMDMANHTFDAVACKHGFDAQSNSFKLTTTSSLASSDQLFINYGPLGNAKLLHLYGFTVPNNEHDYVQMFINMDPSAELYEEKKEFLASKGINSASPNFYLRYSELDGLFPIKILGTVRVQRLTKEDWPLREKAFSEEEFLSEENEVFSLKALEEGLRAMFLMYETPYQDDLTLSEKLNKGEVKLGGNELNALLVRMGDRHIIGKAGSIITVMTEAIRDYLQNKIDTGNTTPIVAPEKK